MMLFMIALQQATKAQMKGYILSYFICYTFHFTCTEHKQECVLYYALSHNELNELIWFFKEKNYWQI